jgi:hypothetical protein
MAPEMQRTHERTSMFVLASMAAGSASGPVKIRNMSQGGALIEGGALPRIGEHLSIRRGELIAAGQIVWCQEGKAGVRFDCEVDVMDWLPAGSRKQQQVEQAVHELKTGIAGIASAPAPRVTGNSPFDRQDLLDVAEALDALADVLAEDPRVIASHSTKLQALDIASQLLRRCTALVPAQASVGQNSPSACAQRA